MTNFKKGSDCQNRSDRPGGTNYALDPLTPITSPTLQRKVRPKIEITITSQQLIAATRLFKDYGKSKPGWLRQKFYINQRRRKCLNTELIEAQLDRGYCGHARDSDDWAGLLHQLWHNINGVQPCFK